MKSTEVSRTNWTSYAVFCLSHLLMHVFSQMHISLIPFFRTEFSLDTVSIGVLVAIPLLMQAVLTIPGGLLADKVNRLRLIAIGISISGVGGILMIFVHSLWQLIFVISLFSISFTVLHPPALSAVGDLASAGIRGKALGVFGSAGTLGIALGPITLSVFVNSLGWRMVYLIWSIPCFLMPILILKLKMDERSRIDAKPIITETMSMKFHFLISATLLLVLAMMGLRSMGGNAITTYITPYFVDVLKVEPTFAIFIFGLNPLMGVFASSLGGVMVDKFGERIWLALGFMAQITSLLLVAFTFNFSLVIVGYLCYAFFGLMEMPAEQSVITKLVPVGSRGLAFSISFLPGTMVGAFSPILVALIIDALGLWTIFPYAILMFIIALICLGSIWKKI